MHWDRYRPQRRPAERGVGGHLCSYRLCHRDLQGAATPELTDASPEELAALFADELTVGIEDTGVRAGFIKLATSDSGPTEEESTIHRAGAMAAVETGAAIALHSPQAGALRTVLRTLEGEGFEPARLVWVHAQESSLAENLELASRGITVSLDAIGTSDDVEMLDRIETLAEAGRQVVLSSDSTFVVHPPELAYQRDITYLDRRFAALVEARHGSHFLDAVRRDNVLRAYGHRGEGDIAFPVGRGRQFRLPQEPQRLVQISAVFADRAVSTPTRQESIGATAPSPPGSWWNGTGWGCGRRPPVRPQGHLQDHAPCAGRRRRREHRPTASDRPPATPAAEHGTLPREQISSTLVADQLSSSERDLGEAARSR